MLIGNCRQMESDSNLPNYSSRLEEGGIAPHARRDVNQIGLCYDARAG